VYSFTPDGASEAYVLDCAKALTAGLVKEAAGLDILAAAGVLMEAAKRAAGRRKPDILELGGKGTDIKGRREPDSTGY
jgi:hypothetical protein